MDGVNLALREAGAKLGRPQERPKFGSRPTEAACKTIVKERLGRSGMRWTRTKGKSVLTLRAIHKSKQWDQTWNEYRRQLWNKVS